MEKTTGENEAICKTTPKKGMVLRWWPQTICLSSSFLADFWLVLDFASALTTRGSMRRYLQPTEVAQVVLLIQDGTSMRTVARRFAESPSTVSRAWRRYQETGQYTRRRGGGRRRTTTSRRTAIWSFVQGGTGGALPEPYKTTFSRPLM